MPTPDRLQLARMTYGAYESGDRQARETFEGERMTRADVYFGWNL
jgi:hypothetical protein